MKQLGILSQHGSVSLINQSQLPSYPSKTFRFDLAIGVPRPKLLNLALIMSTSQAVPDSAIDFAIPKIDVSISPYDTAWVAMVPSPGSPLYPCFPGCLKWVLENQNSDGSWSKWRSPFLMKDALSSTLACIIALVKWNVGNEEVKKAIHFIQENISFAIDEKQHSLVGFEIIFPSMIECAKQLGLEFPITEDILDAIFVARDLELKRGSANYCTSWETYLAYIAEGFGGKQDWERVMKFQRKNGSLFNSPATTAAALVYVQNGRSLQYLHDALNKHGNAVTSVHPLDICTNLLMIDSLEKMGIALHFRDYIRQILSETYRSWLQDEEELHTEPLTHALAFRLLRMHGYNVSSDAFVKLVEADSLWSPVGTASLLDKRTALELYRASQLKVFEIDHMMDKLHSSTCNLLKQIVSKYTSQDEILKSLIDEIGYALAFPLYANLERLEHKRYIENHPRDSFMMLKSCIVFQSDCKDMINLAVEEFNTCQSIYQDELQLLQRWLAECKIDLLTFARQKLAYCYFTAAATIFQPEFSDARLSWAKNSVLTTVVDDFFDVGGSQEEIATFLGLVERWDVNYLKCSCSQNVKILFSALYTTVNDLGKRAYEVQGYDITTHLIDIWKNVIAAMEKESEWTTGTSIPTVNDYMTNGYISFALGPIILPTLYFMGSELPVDIIYEKECCELLKLVSRCGRLLNDIQGFERESNEGKLNSITLRISQSAVPVTEEVVKRELRGIIDQSRTELFRLILLDEGSIVPRQCKDLFWKMSRVLHFFYARGDGFTSPTEMVSAVDAVFFTPLEIPP